MRCTGRDKLTKRCSGSRSRKAAYNVPCLHGVVPCLHRRACKLLLQHHAGEPCWYRNFEQRSCDSHKLKKLSFRLGYVWYATLRTWWPLHLLGTASIGPYPTTISMLCWIVYSGIILLSGVLVKTTWQLLTQCTALFAFPRYSQKLQFLYPRHL